MRRKNIRNMRYITMALTALLSPLSGFSQQSNTWYAFWNSDTTLIGFRDKDSKVKIPPRFEPFATAARFDHIIAVMEKDEDGWNSYYLTKSGKSVATDSLYIFDNTPDCESEGHIRFQDKLTGKTGMLDRNGKIAIPALYNAMTPVHNGMSIVLKGAEKVMWDKHEGGCEHFSWKGGTEMLVDTTNHVLVENFPYNDGLCLASMAKTTAPHTDSNRRSFPATDGSYYSFIDFDLEFEHWLKSSLLKDLTAENLHKASFDTITYEGSEGWEQASSKNFVENNYTLLNKELKELAKPGTDWFITKDGLNPFMFTGPGYEQYYDNCNQAKDWIYPVMSVVINYQTAGTTAQSHYQFLRTKDGYRLICVALGKGLIR